MRMTYTVDVEALADAVRILDNYADHCAKQLLAVEKLVSSSHLRWTGEAAAEYEARHRDWVQRADSMRQHILAVRDRGAAAAAAYEAAMTANLKMFS